MGANPSDAAWMRLALRLARQASGETSPNPQVGAVVVRAGKEIGRGWHHRAGLPHAEIEALRDAERRGNPPEGASLFVTLEPCSTHGRTPPCVEAILAARIARVIVAATDPNPRHAARGFDALRAAGVEVTTGILAESAARMNKGFNHWIVHRKPWVTLKVGMTLDGKIATASGESKWITGPASRRHAMRLRQAADVILVGVGTVIADDPSLTVRLTGRKAMGRRRWVLDTHGRTPPTAQIVTDSFADLTVLVIGENAASSAIETLAERVRIVRAPIHCGRIDLRWLMAKLGEEEVTQVLVEGGGEVHGALIEAHLAHEVAFFYAPKILGGSDSIPAVGGNGALSLAASTRLFDVRSRKMGDDLFVEAGIEPLENRG